ncbi:hypothetical protein H0G86_000411 [Trichoderma simmonsii]|uniref:C2H2-type domain-containing protein n=1 Tax=Trichoderma simmonsii TaxID=1491479 RepID=A0A8G0L4V6_9HYPO|nr:hypothetical protein H0G86_000411 [Trichoderma simmonsii]
MREKVEQALSELFRISAAIRSAGMSYRHTKAANFVEWQDGVNLTQKFREGVELLLQYKKPSPIDYMAKRLIETVCLRQRELAYSRRKRAGRSGKEAKEESFKSHSLASLPPRSTAGYSRQGGSGSTPSRLAHTAIGAFRGKTAHHDAVQSTVYTATYVPTTVFPQTKPMKSLMIRPQWSTIDDSLTNLPLPPEVGKNLEFECPYCGIPLARAIFQGPAWRNHALEDLRPYVCILPDCKTPHALYKNSDSWISHMQTKHKVAKWKCVSSCQSNIRTFQTEAEFLTHTENEHKEDFTTEEMLELANIGRYEINCELGADILPECPICTISFEDHDFLIVYNHIAEELAEYAWISLPESPNADINVSQKASSKSASVDEGRIGQRRESEIEADKMFPWSLWDSDDPETKSDLFQHDADLKLIPDPSDVDVTMLADIRSDIRNARHERLQQEPDPSQNLLREYRDEINPDEDEDVLSLPEVQSWYDEAASNLLERQELDQPQAVEDRLPPPPQENDGEGREVHIHQGFVRGKYDKLNLDKYENMGTSTGNLIEYLETGFHNNPNHQAASYYEELEAKWAKEKRDTIYEDKKSGYNVSVERLLWVDGYEGCPLEGESTISDREMTLVVLKIALASHNPSVKSSFMKASLTFEDTGNKQHQGLNEPRVEAWAPFHSMERQHLLIPYETKMIMSRVIGSASVGREPTKTKKKTQNKTWHKVFNKWHSNPETSPLTGHHNGITWALEQNGLERCDILQEICVAVLISRTSSEPYHVRFQVDTRLGALEDFKNKTRQFFGRNPNKAKPFLVSPGKNVVCKFEGNDIIESIDLENLGRLRDQGNNSILNLELGKYYKFDASTTS